jgi:hypothetical protein
MREFAVKFYSGFVVGKGGGDFVIKIAEVVGSVGAPYRGSLFRDQGPAFGDRFSDFRSLTPEH